MPCSRIEVFAAFVLIALAGCHTPESKTGARRLQLDKPRPDMFSDDAGDEDMPDISPETHVAAARVFESHGLTDKAIDQYRKAIASGRPNPGAHHRLGILLSMRGQRAEALEAFRAAVELAPDNAVFHNNLGFELLLSEKWREAEEEFHQAIKLNPSFPRAYVNMGIVQSKLGRFDNALLSFLKVLPEADAYYNLALMFRGQKRYREADRILRHVLLLDPSFVAAREQLEQIAARNLVRGPGRSKSHVALTSTPSSPVSPKPPKRRSVKRKSPATKATPSPPPQTTDAPNNKGPSSLSLDEASSDALQPPPSPKTGRQTPAKTNDRPVALDGKPGGPTGSRAGDWAPFADAIEIAENEMNCLDNEQAPPDATDATGSRASPYGASYIEPEHAVCRADDDAQATTFTPYDLAIAANAGDRPVDAWALIQHLDEGLAAARKDADCPDAPTRTLATVALPGGENQNKPDLADSAGHSNIPEGKATPTRPPHPAPTDKAHPRPLAPRD